MGRSRSICTSVDLAGTATFKPVLCPGVTLVVDTSRANGGSKEGFAGHFAQKILTR